MKNITKVMVFVTGMLMSAVVSATTLECGFTGCSAIQGPIYPTNIPGGNVEHHVSQVTTDVYNNGTSINIAASFYSRGLITWNRPAGVTTDPDTHSAGAVSLVRNGVHQSLGFKNCINSIPGNGTLNYRVCTNSVVIDYATNRTCAEGTGMMCEGKSSSLEVCVRPQSFYTALVMGLEGQFVFGSGYVSMLLPIESSNYASENFSHSVTDGGKCVKFSQSTSGGDETRGPGQQQF